MHRHGEVIQSDGRSFVALKRNKKSRYLVLSQEKCDDQFNAGVVTLLQAAAQIVSCNHTYEGTKF